MGSGKRVTWSFGGSDSQVQQPQKNNNNEREKKYKGKVWKNSKIKEAGERGNEKNIQDKQIEETMKEWNNLEERLVKNRCKE